MFGIVFKFVQNDFIHQPSHRPFFNISWLCASPEMALSLRSSYGWSSETCFTPMSVCSFVVSNVSCMTMFTVYLCLVRHFLNYIISNSASVITDFEVIRHSSRYISAALSISSCTGVNHYTALFCLIISSERTQLKKVGHEAAGGKKQSWLNLIPYYQQKA